MTDAFQLIRKHRGKGLLVDTNLLLLYLVGKTNPGRIQNFKRTRRYTVEDFDLLAEIIAQFRTLITTPHVLTELSNLGRLQGEEQLSFRSCFVDIIEQATEHRDDSRSVVKDPSFERLGLTDAAISALSRHNYLFLTDDMDLYITLMKRGVDVVNFSYQQQLRWAL
jgi:rRNA-processing protein FCF1